MRYCAALVVSLLLVGCGDDDSASCQASAEIFEITAYTKNSDMCGPGGDDLLSAVQQDGPTHFLVTCSSFFGQKIVAAFACQDLESCKAQAAATDTEQVVSIDLSGENSFALTHEAEVTNSTDNCKSVGYSRATVEISGEMASLSESKWSLTDIPEDSEGFCSTDAARSASQTSPCETYLAIRGRRVSP